MRTKERISTVLIILALTVAFVLLSGIESKQEVAQTVDEKLSTRGNEVELEEEPVGGVGVTPAPTQGCVLSASISLASNYRIAVKNTGTRTCKNVSFSIYYSEGERYITATPKPTASDYYWRFGDMRKGAEKVVVLGTSGASTNTELCATANNAQDVCVTAGVVSTPAPTPQPAPTPSGTQEYGLWVWDSPLSLSEARMNEIVQQAKAGGFNAIYITIDDVLTADQSKFKVALGSFVSKANASGIAVDAEFGWRDWAKPENRYKAFAVIDFVKDYNRNYPKIRAVQSDVEPYLLPEYEENKTEVLTHFIEYVAESENRLHGSGIGFSLVIPHFYDSRNNWTPKINGSYTFDFLLSILDRGEGNSIVVMAYRDTFDGSDGVDGIVRQEITQAGKTKVIVAQETGNVEPNYVTFFGKSRSDLVKQVERIRSEYASFAGFGGVAVHYNEPYLELK